MAVNKCIKYLLFFFNLLFWIAGCIILAAAIYVRVTKNQITNVGIPGVNLLIAIGAIIMVLGFLGCCGAIKENRCMLLLFFIGLLIIFILLLIAGILGAIGEQQGLTNLQNDLSKLIPLNSQPTDVQNDIASFQPQLKCCGLINGPKDWGNTAPSSCACNDTSAGCTSYGGQNVYSTPCINMLQELLKTSMKIVLGIAFAFAVLMLFGMAFSMTLYCQIGKGDVTAA